MTDVRPPEGAGAPVQTPSAWVPDAMLDAPPPPGSTPPPASKSPFGGWTPDADAAPARPMEIADRAPRGRPRGLLAAVVTIVLVGAGAAVAVSGVLEEEGTAPTGPSSAPRVQIVSEEDFSSERKSARDARAAAHENRRDAVRAARAAQRRAVAAFRRRARRAAARRRAAGTPVATRPATPAPAPVVTAPRPPTRTPPPTSTPRPQRPEPEPERPPSDPPGRVPPSSD